MLSGVTTIIEQSINTMPNILQLRCQNRLTMGRSTLMYIRPQPLTSRIRRPIDRGGTHRHDEGKYPEVWFSERGSRYLVYGFRMMYSRRRSNTASRPTPWPSWHLVIRCDDIPRVFIAGDQSITALMPAQGVSCRAAVLGRGKHRNDYKSEEIRHSRHDS